MKKLFIVLALIGMGATLVAQQEAHDLYVPGKANTISPLPQPEGQYIPDRAPGDPVLYDNGPLVTHPGSGFGGADASALQNISYGMNTYGAGHQVLQNYWVADDFTVPSGGWNISGYGFYAYQSYSDITSTMTVVHLIIYDGVPGDEGTNIIFGDESTNRLTTTSFTNIYRVLESDMSGNTRPIMLNECKFNLSLAPGTYWIAWQTDGTLTSGPWVPLVTIFGQTTTGNGMQYTTAWGGYYDTGTNTQQGFPFLVYGQKGDPTTIPVSNWALMIGIALIGLTILIRFKRLT